MMGSAQVFEEKVIAHMHHARSILSPIKVYAESVLPVYCQRARCKAVRSSHKSCTLNLMELRHFTKWPPGNTAVSFEACLPMMNKRKIINTNNNRSKPTKGYFLELMI